MFEKPRLLQQFALPTGQTQAFEVEWTRGRDFFEDRFSLVARVAATRVDFDYLHQSPQADAPASIWRLAIEISPKGRARVAFCEGIDPSVRTVLRAADVVGQALRQVQAPARLKKIDNVCKPSPAP
jgi:hypothetical protein